jgi:hypothetical protein
LTERIWVGGTKPINTYLRYKSGSIVIRDPLAEVVIRI